MADLGRLQTEAERTDFENRRTQSELLRVQRELESARRALQENRSDTSAFKGSIGSPARQENKRLELEADRTLLTRRIEELKQQETRLSAEIGTALSRATDAGRAAKEAAEATNLAQRTLRDLAKGIQEPLLKAEGVLDPEIVQQIQTFVAQGSVAPAMELTQQYEAELEESVRALSPTEFELFLGDKDVDPVDEFNLKGENYSQSANLGNAVRKLRDVRVALAEAQPAVQALPQREATASIQRGFAVRSEQARRELPGDRARIATPEQVGIDPSDPRIGRNFFTNIGTGGEIVRVESGQQQGIGGDPFVPDLSTPEAVRGAVAETEARLRGGVAPGEAGAPAPQPQTLQDKVQQRIFDELAGGADARTLAGELRQDGFDPDQFSFTTPDEAFAPQEPEAPELLGGPEATIRAPEAGERGVLSRLGSRVDTGRVFRDDEIAPGSRTPEGPGFLAGVADRADDRIAAGLARSGRPEMSAREFFGGAGRAANAVSESLLRARLAVPDAVAGAVGGLADSAARTAGFESAGDVVGAAGGFEPTRTFGEAFAGQQAPLAPVDRGPVESGRPLTPEEEAELLRQQEEARRLQGRLSSFGF